MFLNFIDYRYKYRICHTSTTIDTFLVLKLMIIFEFRLGPQVSPHELRTPNPLDKAFSELEVLVYPYNIYYLYYIYLALPQFFFVKEAKFAANLVV